MPILWLVCCSSGLLRGRLKTDLNIQYVFIAFKYILVFQSLLILYYCYQFAL